VPGPDGVAVGASPSCGKIGGREDTAIEVGRSPVLSFRRGEQQSQWVDAGLLFGGYSVDAGGELVGEGVARRGGAREDGLPSLMVLGRLQVKVPGDLDDLAVYPDHPRAEVDLGTGQRGELAPAQPGVGRGVEHQLTAVPIPPGGQSLPLIPERT
jgi:hypothetical protein